MATYVANKRNTANITHIFWYDASVPAYSPNLMHAALPYNLLPVVPAANDAVYFGINTAWVDSGPFCSLAFDIGTAQVDLTISWQYWNGAWVALTTQDNTNQDGAGTGQEFDTTGEKSVHWEQPSDWATVAVNGITGYWVRAIVTVVGGAPSPPTQQNRDVYSIVWPYVEIQAAAVGGDIPAISRLKLRNQSDTNHGVSGLEANSQRVVCGLRSYDRGADFNAYLNLADEQNHSDITVATLGSGGFANDVQAPAGRSLAIVNPGIALPCCQITIAYPLSQEYNGKFAAYLRGKQTSGVAGDVALQMYGYMGGANVFWVSPEVEFPTTNDWQLLSLGMVTINADESAKAAWYLFFELHASGNGASDAKLYDFILLPVDEWAADCCDPENGALGWGKVGYRSSPSADNAYLDIDPISDPKKRTSLVVRYADDRFRASWATKTNGEPVLQANARQRLWFLSSRLEGTNERSESFVSHSVGICATQRYLFMRGAR